MKIGILTYHRAENYGALLQAYATYAYLKGQGHDVSFVDYWPTYHSDYFKLFSLHRFWQASLKGKIATLASILVWGFTRAVRKQRLQRFMHERLNLRKQPLYTRNTDPIEPYDTVVYGSDQIWRKQHLGGVEFDDLYFGADIVQAANKVVYAGSMGVIDTTLDDDTYVQRMMRNFQHIAVREKNLQSYLHGLGVSSTLVADPVFLLSRDQWQKIAHPESPGDYILFYNLLNTPEATRFANALSRQTGLRVVEFTKALSLNRVGRRYVRTASVERFLGLIAGARFVVSNSFHGVAFSIIFERQFWAVGMGQKADRVTSLLAELGINDRYVSDGRLLKYSEIDYHKVYPCLKDIVNTSINYLNNALSS